MHPIIVKLNQLRQVDNNRAEKICMQMLDNILLASAVPHDLQNSTDRSMEILDDLLQMKADSIPIE